MELIKDFLDFILHIDKHLVELSSQYGLWIYAILFLIVFCETGLVVTPLLPGDSLLFATGTIVALPESGLNIYLMALVITVAAILGDTTNYHIGKYIGKAVFHKPNRFIKLEYLHKTHAFYEKHGGKTIIYARFVPIIRTFAPFVAGVGVMNYGRFIMFNVVGGILWVVLFLGAGYWLGNIPFVRENFSIVILAIIVVSLIPVILEFIKARFGSRKSV